MAVWQNADLSVTAQLDPTYDAGRMSIWPQDALGGYRGSFFTGLTTGIAANGEVFQFRWTDANNLCVLKYLSVRAAVITGFTAAQEIAFDAIQSASWSVSGTGGTAITPGATTLLKRSNYPQSKVGDMRIATTAALGAGTKTLYGHPFLTGVGKTLAAAATVQDAAIEKAIDMTNSGDDPMVFQQNEGFSVRNSIAQGAAGTVRWSIEVAWAEFLNADYPSL